jgi:hypothetical protein
MSTEALKLAIKFHDTYERLAPAFGYETRADTKAFNPDSANGKLMQAVCAELLPAAAPAGGADPVAWMYTLWFGDEAVRQVAFCYRFDLAVASPFGREGIDFAAGGKVEEQPLYAAPTAQPQPAEYLPQTWVAAVAEECGVGVERMSCLFDFAERVQRAARLAASQPTLLNGLTEQETTASASVAGLSGAQPERRLCPTENLWDANGQPKPDAWKRAAQPEAPAEPSDNPERDEFYRVFNESAKLTGHKPTLYDVWLMARGRMDTSHRTIATPTPVSQRPAELTEPAARTFEQLLKHIPKPSPEERAAQLAASQATESMRGKLLMTEAEPPAEPTDEQVADAVERSFSELHEWPGNDGDVVRAFLKHWPAIKAQGGSR